MSTSAQSAKQTAAEQGSASHQARTADPSFPGNCVRVSGFVFRIPLRFRFRIRILLGFRFRDQDFPRVEVQGAPRI